jgi:putative membrane protein
MKQPYSRIIRTRAVICCVAASTLAACAPANPEPASAPMAEPASASTAAPAMTDANIAAIVVTANTIDVQNGELALAKSSNAQVREFAQHMITDHTAVNKAAIELVTRLGVTPMQNATGTGLKASADATRTRLAQMSGAEFDRAYIANEIAYHQTVLEALDGALIPNAQNPELKATLVSVRPAFVAHLEHAQRVQASLGS